MQKYRKFPIPIMLNLSQTFKSTSFRLCNSSYGRPMLSQTGCLPYLHTWCGLSANLRCRSETCCTQKIAKNSPSGHRLTTLSGYIFATKARIDSRQKTLDSNISPTCPHNIVNFGRLAAEIGLVVWRTQANFNRFRVFASLLHGIRAVGVSQTLQRLTEGATYVRQGVHHVGHWSTSSFCCFSFTCKG